MLAKMAFISALVQLIKGMPLNEGPVKPFLVTLGTVEGKTFYYQDTTTTWDGAKAYCEFNGLELATITTKDEYDFLVGKNSLNDFANHWYWIGARDARSPVQFVWDKGQGSPIKDFGQGWGYAYQQTCVLYYSGTDSDNGYMYGEPCGNLSRILCSN